MPPDEFLNLLTLVRQYEVPDRADPDDDSVRSPLSCRIHSGSHKMLEFLSQRWNISKSGVAAQLLETALNEILEPGNMDERLPEYYLARDYEEWSKHS